MNTVINNQTIRGDNSSLSPLHNGVFDPMSISPQKTYQDYQDEMRYLRIRLNNSNDFLEKIMLQEALKQTRRDMLRYLN